MKAAPDKASYKILLNAGVVSKEMLDQALAKAEHSGRSFLKTLEDEGFLKEEAALDIFSKATGHPVIDLRNTVLDDSIFKRVPVKFASYYKFCPVRYEGDKLWIATSKILDIHTLDEVRFALGFDIGVCFSCEKDIEEMLQKHYGLAADTVEKILSETPAQNRPETIARTQEVEDIEKLAAAPSVAHVVNQIILDAYKKRASDIHLEPLPFGIRLRYRVDGILHEAPVPSELKDFFVPMLSRIKIMANLNVAEKRLPQDGKLRVKTQDETLDLRVSFIPTANGESVVIRILPGKNVFKLEQLGFEEKYLADFKQLLGRHNGIIFVTGPTGSGKSTTLYAALNLLNSPERKIITIEDPVEYELKGVSQIHVNPDIGLTFSNGLRSMLRQDPDVMMVGEVRDLETADISIRAALTGHLILSTLHTNDAASGVTRLMDIGVEPYLIASSVEVFIAQRLVRMICPKCKKENHQISSPVRALIEREQGMAQKIGPLFHGMGCDHCNGTGYRGRVAIHEFLPLNEAIRKLIMARATAETIKWEAVQQGMVTLRQSGWRKVLAGITTPEEILETTEEDIFSVATPEAVRDKSKISSLGEKNPAQEKQGIVPSGQGEMPSSVTEQADFANLRKYKRITCNIPVIYRILDYKGNLPAVQKIKDDLGQFQFEGTIEDLSPGGVLFVTADHAVTQSGTSVVREVPISVGDILEAGNTVDLKVLLPGDEKPVECVAKILRVLRLMKTEKGANKFSYHVAMLFLVIDSVDRSRLEKYCQAHYKPDETI